MNVPAVPTALTFELRMPLRLAPPPRLAGEKSKVEATRAGSVARLPDVMLETSTMLSEPAACAAPDLNSPSFAT